MKKKTLSVVSGAYILATTGLTGCAPQESIPSVRPEAPEATSTPLATLTPSPTTTSTPFATLSPSPSLDAESTEGAYLNGVYNAVGEYKSPAGPETVAVELSLTDGIVTAVTVTPQSQHDVSSKLQQKMAEGIGTLVIGKSLDSIETFASVNGSSLSPQGFQAAVEKIKVEAASQNS